MTSDDLAAIAAAAATVVRVARFGDTDEPALREQVAHASRPVS
ncbi:MAG: hypothetical protein ABSG43_21270 [Solirubrobacteraceae bacterium]